MSLASRTMLLRRMTHIVQVMRASRTHDGSGGFEESYEYVGQAVRARLWSLSATERDRASKEDAKVSHRMLVPSGVNIQRADRVVRSGDDGGFYTVVSTHVGGERDHHVRVELYRPQTGE